ncbi:unnamed protein product [Cyclocybe aegerita]|uniref:Nicotinamide-nucleotide adenylyltransferase n=1 Tax=Cyclocybe aegerita TaxID=1973307 RepID=A0A8S0Y133_CYCAE|nr:unnamed protein product [Cyclocybe aegerita]
MTIRKSAPALLQRLQHGLSSPPVELIYASHSQWPFPQPWSPQQNPDRLLSISVLDSSFNPPTVAHLALANSHPPPTQTHYDAKLLLLSVKNADKTLKPGDASYLQRLEMMYLLSQHIRTGTSSDDPATPENVNIAIAIIDEPTFVGKSDALLKFLKQRFVGLSRANVTASSDVELTFLVGLDTLERLFSPRYYHSEAAMVSSLRKFLSPGPEGDNSRLVCVNRTFAPSTALQVSEELEGANTSDYTKEFIDSGRAAVVEIGEHLSTYSSSAVRSAIGTFGLGQTGGNPAWRNFVTKEVAEYIVEQRLYESDS